MSHNNRYAPKIPKYLEHRPKTEGERFLDVVTTDGKYFATFRTRLIDPDDVRVYAQSFYPTLKGREFNIVKNPYIEPDNIQFYNKQ